MRQWFELIICKNSEVRYAWSRCVRDMASADPGFCGARVEIGIGARKLMAFGKRYINRDVSLAYLGGIAPTQDLRWDFCLFKSKSILALCPLDTAKW